MSKNVFDLIAGIIGGVEIIADAVFVYLAATGTLDAKSASAWAGSVTVAGTAAIEICSRFIKAK